MSYLSMCQLVKRNHSNWSALTPPLILVTPRVSDPHQRNSVPVTMLHDADPVETSDGVGVTLHQTILK